MKIGIMIHDSPEWKAERAKRVAAETACPHHEPDIGFVMTTSPPKYKCRHCGVARSAALWWAEGFLRDSPYWSEARQRSYFARRSVAE